MVYYCHFSLFFFFCLVDKFRWTNNCLIHSLAVSIHENLSFHRLSLFRILRLANGIWYSFVECGLIERRYYKHILFKRRLLEMPPILIGHRIHETGYISYLKSCWSASNGPDEIWTKINTTKNEAISYVNHPTTCCVNTSLRWIASNTEFFPVFDFGSTFYFIVDSMLLFFFLLTVKNDLNVW